LTYVELLVQVQLRSEFLQSSDCLRTPLAISPCDVTILRFFDQSLQR
jgi:hypothetical protein